MADYPIFNSSFFNRRVVELAGPFFGSRIGQPTPVSNRKSIA